MKLILSIALLLVLLVLLCGCVKTTLHGIPNFAVVKPGIYRGGQPTYEGWRYLASIGVSNVIKLNTESEGSDATARLFKMTVFTAPISFSEQIGWSPIDAQNLENVSVSCPWNYSTGGNVDKNAGCGLFVHCEHGQDRTGLFVAMERVRWDYWTKADAEKEMLAHGFHKSLHGLWEFWENYKK